MFSLETGEVVSVFRGSERYLEVNTPAGTRPIEGRYDKQTHRLDLETGQVAMLSNT